MSSPLVLKIEQHAASAGARGKVDMARLALKFGKKLDLASVADDNQLRTLAKEIFGRDF